MTRKRYVKLMMAVGITRNDAEVYAGIARMNLVTPYRSDAESWERVFRIAARSATDGWVRDYLFRSSAILQQALYGRVSYE